MTLEERERMFALCDRIAKEKNHARFLKLVLELNGLLQNQEGRLNRGDSPQEEIE
jgi:hypothetical protein